MKVNGTEMRFFQLLELATGTPGNAEFKCLHQILCGIVNHLGISNNLAEIKDFSHYYKPNHLNRIQADEGHLDMQINKNEYGCKPVTPELSNDSELSRKELPDDLFQRHALFSNDRKEWADDEGEKCTGLQKEVAHHMSTLFPKEHIPLLESVLEVSNKGASIPLTLTELGGVPKAGDMWNVLSKMC